MKINRCISICCAEYVQASFFDAENISGGFCKEITSREPNEYMQKQQEMADAKKGITIISIQRKLLLYLLSM